MTAPSQRSASPRRRRRGLVAVTVGVLLAGVAGCTGGEPAGGAAHSAGSGSRPGSAAPGSAAAPAEQGAAAGATLTGKPGPTGPVIVIKVDNVPSAQPLQRGLDAAALVYQEVVEGGITRFMAVYVGAGNTVVGPVRSVRDTDLAILAPYGRVVLGFSGANAGVLAHVRAADLLEVPYDYVHKPFWVAGRRREAFNIYTTPDRLLATAGDGAADVRDVGLRFGPASAGGAPVTAPVTVAFSYRTTVTLSYDAPTRTWRLRQNRRPLRQADGTVVAPANVVVQRVSVRTGRYVDKAGYASPDTQVIGTGALSVYRDGRRFDGTWSRPRLDSTTRYLGPDGRDIPLAPGQTWILLAPERPIGPSGPAARRFVTPTPTGTGGGVAARTR
ncbi:MAG TPA: DUF3048 domain-containing protein [Mycobacteriales bacterium]|nr:DUF3048 domain-containing protein [Mycobacteriales bacterium]